MTDKWNPRLEQMDRGQLRELQLRKFKDQLAYAYHHSPFYAEKLDAAGIDPTAVDSLADIRRIPTTTKAELREAQQAEPFPFGRLLATDLHDVTEYHQTSGTTGQPVRQADSWRDWEWWSECWATVLWAQGIRPSDRVFFPFSYNVFIAFWAGHYACEKIGAEVVPGGNLSSIQRVRMMHDLDVTAFMSTPTYALRLAEVAADEGFSAEDFSIDRIVCAGEPGASIPGTKRRIESRWDAAVFDHAGATEGGAWGFTCTGNSLGLHLNEAMFLLEVLDDTDDPVEPGDAGRLVITPLDRQAQPYIRFELRDRIELAPSDACDCGRSFRLASGGILGRLDDMTKVNGVLVSPTVIEDTVRRFDGVTDEYRVVIDTHDQKNIDVIGVIAEIDPDIDRDTGELEQALREDLKQATGLTFQITFEPPGSLERFELKADRVTDKRETT